MHPHRRVPTIAFVTDTQRWNGEPKGELPLSTSRESVSHCFLPFNYLFVCKLESTAASGGIKEAEQRCTTLSESSNGQVSNCKNCQKGEGTSWNYVLFKACFLVTAEKHQTCLCNSFSYHNLVFVLTWNCDTSTSGIRLHWNDCGLKNNVLMS